MASRACRPARNHTIIAIVVSLSCVEEPDITMAPVGKLLQTYLEISRKSCAC